MVHLRLYKHHIMALDHVVAQTGYSNSKSPPGKEIEKNGLSYQSHKAAFSLQTTLEFLSLEQLLKML